MWIVYLLLLVGMVFVNKYLDLVIEHANVAREMKEYDKNRKS